MFTSSSSCSSSPTTPEPVTNVRLILREMFDLYEPITNAGGGGGVTPQKVILLASKLSKAIASADKNRSFRERSHLLAALLSVESVHILYRRFPTAAVRNAALQNLLRVFQCLEACVSEEESDEGDRERDEGDRERDEREKENVLQSVTVADLNPDSYILGHVASFPFADCWATHARLIASFVPTSSIGRFRASSKLALAASHQPNRGGLSNFSFHACNSISNIQGSSPNTITLQHSFRWMAVPS